LEPTLQIAKVTPGNPAADAGIKDKESIIAINGQPLRSAEQMINTLRQSPNVPLRLTVRAEGGANAPTRVVTVTPRAETDGGETVGRIGIAPGVTIVPGKRLGLAAAMVQANQATVGFFDKLFSIFRSGPREIGKNVGGPIAIFDETRKSVDAGPVALILLTANLSLSLGFFNLLPIPVLDGGHLTLLTLEAVRRRKLTAVQTQRVLAAGLAVIALLFVVILFNDVTKRILGWG
jgi:regulator of sigma E protease